MEKKALASQVDWIIGIGMFLLAMGFIFALFKPGVTQVHSANILLEIVEEEFRAETFWDVNKIPIFIKPAGYKITDGTTTRTEAIPSGKILLSGKINSVDGHGNPLDAYSIENDKNAITALLGTFKNENPELRDVNDENMLKYIELFYVGLETSDTSPSTNENDEGIESLSTSGGGDNDIFTIKFLREDNTDFPKIIDTNENGVKFNINGDKFYIDGKTVLNEKTKYSLFYSREKMNIQGGNFGEFDPRNLYKVCEFAGKFSDFDSNKITYASANEACKGIFQIGVSEKLTGISIAKLRSHESENIDSLKTRWGFPADKEFKIIISGKDLDNKDFNTNSENTKKGLIFPDEAIIPSNANVFTKRFNDFILNDDGVQIPVTVTIQVW